MISIKGVFATVMVFDQEPQTQQKKSTRLWVFFCIAIIILLTCLQWHSLHNNFVSDDYDWVRNARERVEQKNWLDAFKTPTGGNFYRPLVAFSFELDYVISGYTTFGYHAHQLLFHIALVLGVAFLLWQLFQKKSIAFTITLLFAVYPSQHEVVTWIAGRPDLYAATFSVFALAFFVLFLRKKQWWAYSLSLLFCLLGFLSKEISFVIPALAILCIFVVIQKITLKTFGKALLWVIPIIIILGGVLLIRSHVISDAIGGYLVGTERKGLDFESVNIAKPFTSITYLVNWSFVLDKMGHVGSATQSLFQKALRHWLILGVVAILAVTFILLKMKKREQRIVLAFGIVWSLLAFVPVYGLSGAISLNLTASRLFFTSSIGYAIIFTAIIWPFGDSTRWKKIRLGLFTALVVIFAGLWIVNYIPWAIASNKVGEIRRQFTQNKNELIPQGTTHVFVTSIPGLYDGAYMYFGVHSVRETIYELTRNAALQSFLGGNRAYPESPVCQKNPNDHIAIFAWDQAKQQFIKGNAAVTLLLNNPSGGQQPMTWDFADQKTFSNWTLHGVIAQQQANGVALTISKGATYVASPTFSPSFLGAYRSLTIRFKVEKAPPDFGNKRVFISWGSHELFNGGDYLTSSYDTASEQSITIPTCQFLNWVLSDDVTRLRIQPIAEGTILLRSLTLTP